MHSLVMDSNKHCGNNKSHGANCLLNLVLSNIDLAWVSHDQVIIRGHQIKY